MAFDINNFVIDRVVRGVALSQKDDSVLFSINQMQNVSLNCASESTDAVDALGTPIATFYRAKTAEFSAENALFDMNLMATQLGTAKKVASASNKVTAPAMKSHTVTTEATSRQWTMKPTPKVAPAEIYVLNEDSTFGDKYTLATDDGVLPENSKGSFTYAGGILTLPEAIAAGSDVFAIYEYETENAVEVVNSATNFPVGCKFIMEVLGCDVCDQTNLVYAYVIFNNFKPMN